MTPPTTPTNALYSSNKLLFFETRDPQCFFSELGIEELREIVEISIDLKFFGLAERALEQIVAFQKEQLSAIEPQGLSMTVKQVSKSILQTFSGSQK